MICTDRIERTDVTRPNVGELTTVSIDPQIGSFRTLFACTRRLTPRVPRTVKFFIRLMLNVLDPGPTIRLRVELPKVPTIGTLNADVLKNRSIVGSSIAIGSPL